MAHTAVTEAGIRTAAFLTMHANPLGQIGEGVAGGMSVYALELAKQLTNHGIDVDIFTRRARRDPDDFTGNCQGDIAHAATGVRVIHVPAGPPGLSRHELSHYALAFAGAVEEFSRANNLRYDVIHSHYWLSGLAGVALAKAWRAPHVMSFHTVGAIKTAAFPENSEPPERHDAEQAIARSADGILAWTSHEKDALVSMLGADPERIATAPIGIDTACFHPTDKGAARRMLGIPDEEETLLYVGRLDPIKGADVLLRAAGLLADRPRLHVRFVGGDVTAEYSAELRALTSELGIAARVTWTGIVDHDALPWQYAAADIVVVPSYSESFSIVAAEAMACGRPVIASNVPGPASFIVDSVSGRLVAPGDAGALARAIHEILDDVALMQRLGDGALEAAQCLTWSASGDAARRMYERVCCTAQTSASDKATLGGRTR